MTQSIDHDLSLAIERGDPEPDVVACDCGHDELVDDAQQIGSRTACLNCYEACRDYYHSIR